MIHYKDFETKDVLREVGAFKLIKAELKVIKTGKIRAGYLVEDSSQEELNVKLFLDKHEAFRCFKKRISKGGVLT